MQAEKRKNLQIDRNATSGRVKSQGMRANHPCDAKDLEILRTLQKNSRTPFLEIARSLNVSGATVHERIRNLEKGDIIEGYTARLNYKKLGFEITAIANLTLEHPSLDLHELTEGLLSIPEITEAHNLTGDTDLLLTIKTRSIDDLRDLLTEKIQNLPGVKKLDTSIVLDSPVPQRAITF
jgi:Lrp/AsnC family transcriptional regulator for asnA, asnC and gidA